MDLKEYIKSLVRQQVDEMSVSADVGVQPSKMAFSKGKGKNAATKAAERQGFKVTKGETEMPADSKVRDYKSLWSKKKKRVKIYNEAIGSTFQIGSAYTIDNKGDYDYKGVDKGTDKFKFEDPTSKKIIYINPDNPEDIKRVKKLYERSNYDQASKYGAASSYTAASGYTGQSLATKGGGYYASAIKETMENIVKEELLNEVTYHKFKNEVKFRTKNEQLHKAIREVKRKLAEIDRIVEYTSRMKQELSEGEEGLKYWKKTESNIAAISEMVNHLNNKIKNLNQ